jgi:hypothetical protein
MCVGLSELPFLCMYLLLILWLSYRLGRSLVDLGSVTCYSDLALSEHHHTFCTLRVTACCGRPLCSSCLSPILRPWCDGARALLGCFCVDHAYLGVERIAGVGCWHAHMYTTPLLFVFVWQSWCHFLCCHSSHCVVLVI